MGRSADVLDRGESGGVKIWKRVWEDFFESNPLIVLMCIACVLGCVAWTLFVLGL